MHTCERLPVRYIRRLKLELHVLATCSVCVGQFISCSPHELIRCLITSSVASLTFSWLISILAKRNDTTLFELAFAVECGGGVGV